MHEYRCWWSVVMTMRVSNIHYPCMGTDDDAGVLLMVMVCMHARFNICSYPDIDTSQLNVSYSMLTILEVSFVLFVCYTCQLINAQNIKGNSSIYRHSHTSCMHACLSGHTLDSPVSAYNLLHKQLLLLKSKEDNKTIMKRKETIMDWLLCPPIFHTLSSSFIYAIIVKLR